MAALRLRSTGADAVIGAGQASQFMWQLTGKATNCLIEIYFEGVCLCVCGWQWQYSARFRVDCVYLVATKTAYLRLGEMKCEICLIGMRIACVELPIDGWARGNRSTLLPGPKKYAILFCNCFSINSNLNSIILFYYFVAVIDTCPRDKMKLPHLAVLIKCRMAHAIFTYAMRSYGAYTQQLKPPSLSLPLSRSVLFAFVDE